MAQWLDTALHGFDYAILAAIHEFALATGGFFDWIMLAITSLANDGLGMIALGLVLFSFKRTRKTGMAVLFGILVGALITNVTLKPLVYRARPYTHEEFRVWWEAMGAHLESERSFPSGHTTSAMAAMMGIFLTTNKRYSWTALLFAVLMGITRMYIVVHYPTDIIGGLIAGALGGLGGFVIAVLIWRFLQAHKESKLFGFVLQADPIPATVRRITRKGAREEAAEKQLDVAEQTDTEQTDAQNGAE